MLRLTAQQMQTLAAERRERHEVAMVLATVREHGDAAALPPEPLLSEEVRTTLRRCDELGLVSDADRISFCLWELILYTGLRDLPELPEMLKAAGGEPDARLSALFLAAPLRIWATLFGRREAVRRERGWPVVRAVGIDGIARASGQGDAP